MALGALIFPALVVAALFPGIVVMNELNYMDEYYWYLSVAPLAALSFIVLLSLEIVAVKWLLLGRVKEGTHRVHTLDYLRRWFFNQTMDLSLDILGPLYASIFLAPWYKMLGAKMGDGAEVSTASFISPDLLSIDDGSFVADSVSMGAPRVRDGVVATGRNHVGKRSFIGNSALLPPGAVIGDNVLIGCLSAPPASPADALREDSAWLGSPAIFLPQRQKSAGFSDETTFHPNWKLRAQRAAIEFFRVLAPSTGFIIIISLLFSALLLLKDYFSAAADQPLLNSCFSEAQLEYFSDHETLMSLLCFPFLYVACGLAAALITLAAKWTLVWRYRPGEKPLWSTAVWRNELINALHEHLAAPFLVDALTGTPFVCWHFRLLGAKIGRRVYMETTDFTEFDLVRIGDEAALNADCTIQTHLFEDRVMKMSNVQHRPARQRRRRFARPLRHRAGRRRGAGRLLAVDERGNAAAAEPLGGHPGAAGGVRAVSHGRRTGKRTGKRTCKSVKQDENREKGTRWSWMRIQMGTADHTRRHVCCGWRRAEISPNRERALRP